MSTVGKDSDWPDFSYTLRLQIRGEQIDQPVAIPKFRPIGPSIGIFKYGNYYYFDTFFDSWGDCQNRRPRYKHIDDTLGVFLRQNGKTRQVCEYRMFEAGYHDNR